MIFFLALVQLFFSVVIGLYFLNQLRSQREGKTPKAWILAGSGDGF